VRYSVEKPGSPAELVHHGIKGMKWGVRKSNSETSSNKSAAKKVVIGAGVVTATVAAAFIARSLGQKGNVSVSAIQTAKDISAAKDFISASGISGKHASEAAKYAEMFLKEARK
jgi:hypothetical protein